MKNRMINEACLFLDFQKHRLRLEIHRLQICDCDMDDANDVRAKPQISQQDGSQQVCSKLVNKL